MEKLERTVGAITKYFDYVARIAIFGMMALVTINVILRYLWKSVPGTYDYVQLITAVCVGAAIAYTAYERGNIEIELLMERFSERVQAIVASVIMLIVLGFFAIATWQVLRLAHDMNVKGETTMTAYIPFHPFLYLIAVGLGLTMVVMFSQLARHIAKLVKS